LNQKEYNEQAINWREAKEGEVFAKLVYAVARTDALHYATKAIEDPDPWYLKNSPFGKPIVPPGYFYSEYIRLLTVPNYFMGVLNSQLSFESLGPIFHGEHVTVTGSIERKYEKRGRPYFDVLVLVKKADGNVVGRGVVTLLLEMEG
jgi:hypothetical protein